MFGGGAQRPGARRRPHRLPADPRRQPAGLERLAADRARHARAGSARSASAAARSSSSTRAAAARREEADEHHFIRPGTDALLLFAIVNVLFAEGLVDPGRLAELRQRRRRARAARASRSRPRPSRRSAASTPTRSAGSPASWPRAERAAVYGRIGTTTQGFGTLASWLVDVAQRPHRQPRPRGRRDVPARRRRPAQHAPARGPRQGRAARPLDEPRRGPARVVRRAARRRPRRGDRRRPGEGQVRALVTIAGNPVVSTPDAGRARRARSRRSTSWSRVDIYVNETTRHADVILPAPAPLAKAHYDIALYQLAIRNVANYSPPRSCRSPTASPHEWEIVLRLAAIAAGQGPDADLEAWDDLVVQTLVGREVGARRARRSRAATPAEIARGARRPARARAPARLHAARRPLRRRVRRRPRRADARRCSRRTRTASTSARCGRGSPRCCARRRARSSSPRSRSSPTSRGSRRRSAAATQRPAGADRPPPAALEQLVDAQPAGAGEGQGPLHAAGPPRRRRAPRPRRRRPRARQLAPPARSTSRSR